MRLDETADGVRLRVRAVPGARRDAILGAHGEALRLAVRAAPERGRANVALLEVLSETLSLGRGQVEIVAGATSRDKSVVIRGLGRAELERRLGVAIDGGEHGAAQPATGLPARPAAGPRAPRGGRPRRGAPR